MKRQKKGGKGLELACFCGYEPKLKKQNQLAGLWPESLSTEFSIQKERKLKK